MLRLINFGRVSLAHSSIKTKHHRISAHQKPMQLSAEMNAPKFLKLCRILLENQGPGCRDIRGLDHGLEYVASNLHH